MKHIAQEKLLEKVTKRNFNISKSTFSEEMCFYSVYDLTRLPKTTVLAFNRYITYCVNIDIFLTFVNLKILFCFIEKVAF